MPRRTLLDALQSESVLHNTNKLPFAAKTFKICDKVTVIPD